MLYSPKWAKIGCPSLDQDRVLSDSFDHMLRVLPLVHHSLHYDKSPGPLCAIIREGKNQTPPGPRPMFVLTCTHACWAST